MVNKSHILVVDDDNRIRELLKEYLEDNNFIVSTSIDSENAKIKLERQSREEPAVFAGFELLFEQLFRLLLRRNFFGRIIQDIWRHDPLQVNI